MRKVVLAGPIIVMLSTPAAAGPEWSLLEQGASLLGEARAWVEVCEAEQVKRFDGLLDNVRLILTNAGLQEHEIFRFDAVYEASVQLTAGEDAVDCGNTEPRAQVATGVRLVNEAIADPQ